MDLVKKKKNKQTKKKNLHSEVWRKSEKTYKVSTDHNVWYTENRQ